MYLRLFLLLCSLLSLERFLDLLLGPLLLGKFVCICIMQVLTIPSPPCRACRGSSQEQDSPLWASWFLALSSTCVILYCPCILNLASWPVAVVRLVIEIFAASNF